MSEKLRGIAAGVAGTLIVSAMAAFAVGQSVAAENAAIAAAAASGEIRACAHKTNGKMRLLKPGKKCTKSEMLVTWSVAGPQGPAGPAGPAGPEGLQGLPGVSGGGVLVLDGDQKLVPDAILNGGVSLLRDGVLWTVAWDGTVAGYDDGGDIVKYSDDQCTKPAVPTTVPAQVPFSVEGKYRPLIAVMDSGTLYEIPFGSTGCFEVPGGAREFYPLDMGTELTKPADLTGPITLSLG